MESILALNEFLDLVLMFITESDLQICCAGVTFTQSGYAILAVVGKFTLKAIFLVAFEKFS